MRPLILSALISQGCVVYQKDRPRLVCPECDDSGDTGGGESVTVITDIVPPDETPAPPDEDPLPVYAFSLSVTEGTQGDTVLTTLTVSGDPLDLRHVSSIDFLGDVTVADSIVRGDEIILAIDIPHDAELGTDPVLVDLNGTGWLVASGFTVVEAAEGTTDPCP